MQRNEVGVLRLSELDESVMNDISPRLMRAFQLAAAVIDWEIRKRQRLKPSFNPDEVWASVTHDANIRVGTPLLHGGEGYYVNHLGSWEEV